MSLLDRLTDEYAGDGTKATTSLGALLMTMRLALNNEEFAHVKTAIPDTDQLVSRAGNAVRTGEVLTLLTPDSLQGRLVAAGLSEEQIQSLGRVVGRQLQDGVPEAVMTKLGDAIPLLAATAHR